MSSGASRGITALPTHRGLLDGAMWIFADQGVSLSSLIEIYDQAGAESAGDVADVLGPRDQMLVAVLSDYDAVALRQREGDLLAAAALDPDSLGLAVEAMIRPLAEQAVGWRGAAVLRVMHEALTERSWPASPEVLSATRRVRSERTTQFLRDRMPALPETLQTERLLLVDAFVLNALADRARPLSAQRPPPTGADAATSLNMLIDSVTGALSAWGPPR